MIGIDYGSVDGNKPPDWFRVRAAGVRFVIVRGAYGTTIDPHFQRDWHDIRREGIVRGAYLFLRSPRKGQPTPPTPERQAKALIQALGMLHPTDLPPTLDIEYPGDGRRDTGLSAAQCLDWARVAWQTLRDAYGVPPLIYTSARVWKEDLQNLPAPDLASSPLWLARYPFKTRIAAVTHRATVSQLAWPPVPPPWGDATNVWIHQYQGDATHLPGFTSTVDLNRFRVMRVGSAGDRVKWLQGRLGRERTGVFDDLTEAAVKSLQRKYKLDEDGVVGPATFAPLCWQGGVECPSMHG